MMSERRCVSCMKQIPADAVDCPHCGQHQIMADTASLGLKWNTILRGRYLVGKILGQGGFGITYVGYDLALDIKVAIKEYFPMGSASRNAAISNKILWNTAILSQQQWQKGCDGFLKEARQMAKIDHLPEIVRVRDTFQENQTSYIVMDFVEGMNLKQKLMKQGILKFSECLKLLSPLLKSLDQVHGYGVIHRDISPDNIMVQPNGHLCLLDFGAAKDVSLHPEASQQVTKRGFSPPEQYGGKGALGPWTDVYAVCATMYYCVTGKMIPEAMDRLYGEEIKFDVPVLEPLSEPVIAVLKHGLELRSENRIQSVDQLLTALHNAALHVEKKSSTKEVGFKILEAEKDKKPVDEKKTDVKAEKQEKRDSKKKTFSAEKSQTPQPPKKKGKLILAAVLAAICIVLVALMGRCSAEDAEKTSGTTPVETTAGIPETSPVETTAEISPVTEPSSSEERTTEPESTTEVETSTEAETTTEAAAVESTPEETTPAAPETTQEPPETTPAPPPETTPAPPPETTAAPAARGGSNLLMAEIPNATERMFDYELPKNIFRSSYTRDSIRTVTFLDTLAGMPADAWDVSANMDGSVMAWVTPSEEDNRRFNLFIAGEGGVKATSGRDLFRKYHHCVEYNFNGCFDTSQVTDMVRMFGANLRLQTLDLSCFDTSNVTDMRHMFNDCESLRTLNVSHFDVSSVKKFGGMFQDCESLWTVDLSGWKISSEAEADDLFSGTYLDADKTNLSY